MDFAALHDSPVLSGSTLIAFTTPSSTTMEYLQKKQKPKSLNKSNTSLSSQKKQLINLMLPLPSTKHLEYTNHIILAMHFHGFVTPYHTIWTLQSETFLLIEAVAKKKISITKQHFSVVVLPSVLQLLC